MKCISLLSLFIILGCNPETKNIDLLISNVNIIDIITGEISKNQKVLIDNSKIIAILNLSEETGNYNQKIDGTGKYLIPAFWDMHVHIQDSSYLKMFLDYGIVGVRDMGGCISTPTNGCESLCPDILNKWKEKIQNNQLDGPNLYISGPPLSGTGWPTSLPATNVEEVQNSFEIILNSNVDFVKVYENIPSDAYGEIARLCNIHKLDFVGHVSQSLLLSEISDLGQKSIEHIREPIIYSFTNKPNELESFMTEDSYSKEDRLFVKPWIDDAEKTIDAFKRNKTWFVPTMTVQFARQRYNDSAWINHSLRKQLPKSVNDGLTKHMERMRANLDKKGDSLWWMALQKLVNRFNNEGIGLLAGTDLACEGGIPGYSLHEELKLLVDAGLSPLEALQTATINPAIYFNLKSSGQIKKNYTADLILLDKNPLTSIQNTLLINTIVRKGKIYIARNKTPANTVYN